MLMVAVVCMGVGVGLALFAVLSQAEEKSVVRSSLRQLDDYEVESVREKELLAPITERAIEVREPADLGRQVPLLRVRRGGPRGGAGPEPCRRPG